MTGDVVNPLTQRLTEIAANAFAHAEPGKPAATILIEMQPGTGVSLTAKEAASALGIPLIRIMSSPDLTMADFSRYALGTGSGSGVVTHTVFDAGKETGGILYIDGPQRLPDDTAKGLARLISGDLTGLPPMAEINLGKWIIMLAKEQWDKQPIQADLLTKADVTIQASEPIPKP